MDPQPEPHSDSDDGGPYAISFAVGAVLALNYFGIRQLHLQYFACGQDDETCNNVSDFFFGWSAVFIGFLVDPGWVATSVIAASVLNQLRPQTSRWVRGLMASVFCALVTFRIIAAFGGMEIISP